MRDVSVACSFCGKRREEVARLIAGHGVYICNECVDLCAAICAEERGKAPMALTGDNEKIGRLIARYDDGTEQPLTGIDIYLSGWGPFYRLTGDVRKCDGGEPGRMNVSVPAPLFFERLGSWAATGFQFFGRVKDEPVPAENEPDRGDS